ncbi:histidine kinase [Lysinibacillus contaminans]|uniref:histidine kinase n=1 Tax=Lysinibacillus contaminans TaxID=1293441 RepID=A0ABR5JY92_9BACI|nr:sensor histidine kinase [Lysinibacillus contaminans]KOS66996.1 histidine kinase [Lysinibacillus contaminans]
MVRKFLIERISWILLFLFLQLLVLSISFVDTTIPLESMFYIVFLSLLIFVVFLTVRYSKETKFYRSLEERSNDLDLKSLAIPDSPFEHIVEQSMITQTEKLKQQATYNRLMLEQEKDDMLAWIHEVKTPLTTMHLMLERMNDEELKALMTYEWLRIYLLLDQQLHQRRIPFIENDLYVDEVDLEDILFQEIKTLQSWCIHKGIGFDIDLTVATVMSDAKWVAFILRQLLTNAVKYSDASDIYIRSEKQDEQVILVIEDSGRGIDAKDLPRIFDKGFTSTTAHHDNAATGMGLYLTKNVAQALLIHIEVQSQLGKGTTFTLAFPKRNDFVNLSVTLGQENL